MSLSAVIVDDEQLARDELSFLLKDVGDINVVAQGKNGLEAVNLISATKYSEKQIGYLAVTLFLLSRGLAPLRQVAETWAM